MGVRLLGAAAWMARIRPTAAVINQSVVRQLFGR